MNCDYGQTSRRIYRLILEVNSGEISEGIPEVIFSGISYTFFESYL